MTYEHKHLNLVQIHICFQLLHPSCGTACLLIFSHPPPWLISATN